MVRSRYFARRVFAAMAASAAVMGCAVGVDVSDEAIASAALHELAPTSTTAPFPPSTLPTTGAPSSSAPGTAAPSSSAPGTAAPPSSAAPTTAAPPSSAAPSTAAPPSSAAPSSTPGAGTSTPPGAMLDSNFIDDLEDGDVTIAPVDGRTGTWFLFNDGAANQTFEIDTACRQLPDNTACARSTVSQVPEYAGFGFSLYADDAPYDASAFRGVRFAGRNAQGGAVTVSLVTASSAAATGSPGFETEVTLSGFFREVEVTFAELALASWYTGPAVAWSASELVRVQFMTGTGSSHDISIDDVEFF